MTRSIARLLADAAQAIRPVSDSPEFDARILLARTLGKPQSYLIAHAEERPDAAICQAFERLVARRALGEPVAYLEGQQAFWSLDLRVSPAVLVPRPETEILVEAALARLPEDAALDIADLGTGSGAIALAVALERPRCRILATDQSSEALAVARQNALNNHLKNVDFLTGHWLRPLEGRRFAMLLSNPPYVRADDTHLDAPSMGYEPRQALIAEDDGLACLREIIAAAPAHLASGGWLLLEHGADQASAVEQLMQGAGLDAVETLHDLAGHPRVTLGQYLQR